jgi:hypothetical protein
MLVFLPSCPLVLECTFPMAQDTNKTANLRQLYRRAIPLTPSARMTRTAEQQLMTGVNQLHTSVRSVVVGVRERAHGSKMRRPPGFRSPPAPPTCCVRSESSLGLSLMRVFRRAWEQGKPHFIVVAAVEAPLSGEAFHELTFTRPHPLRRLRTNPNQRFVPSQFQKAAAGMLSC